MAVVNTLQQIVNTLDRFKRAVPKTLNRVGYYLFN
jgi:hypothetical protein